MGIVECKVWSVECKVYSAEHKVPECGVEILEVKVESEGRGLWSVKWGVGMAECTV